MTEEFTTLKELTRKDIVENAELKKEVKCLKEKIEQLRWDHAKDLERLQGQGT